MTKAASLQPAAFYHIHSEELFLISVNQSKILDVDSAVRRRHRHFIFDISCAESLREYRIVCISCAVFYCSDIFPVRSVVGIIDFACLRTIYITPMLEIQSAQILGFIEINFKANQSVIMKLTFSAVR